MASPDFPGHILKRGDGDTPNVRRIQRRLNARGCGPVETNGIFDLNTERAVKLFQARFPDIEGQPLLVDGKVGSITWAALFDQESVPAADTPPSLLLGSA